VPFPKNFPDSAELNRIAELDDFYKLYQCDVYYHDGTTDRGAFRLQEFFSNDTKKSEILAIALNIAPLIADVGTDFLFAEEVKIEVDEEVKGREKLQKQIDEIIERNNLLEKLDESSTLFQVAGFTNFKIYRGEDGKAVVEEIPYDYWFPNWSGVTVGGEPKNHRIVVYLDQVNDNNVTEKFVYIEDYYLEGEEENQKCVIEYSLWKEGTGRKLGDQVSLDELGLKPANAELKKTEGEKKTLTAVQRTDMTRLPFASVHHRKTVKERYGISIYKRVVPLLNELNDRLTQVSLQFLKHLDPLLQLPESAILRDAKTGKIQRVNLEVILAKQGDPDAKYVTNENPQIEQAFKHMERVIRSIAKLTQTPDSFLMEDEKGGVEKAESLRVRLMSFLKRIRRYQRKYDKAIKRIISLALEAETKKKQEEVPLNITFDLGLPKDWRYDEEVWGSALERGIASKRKAIARFQGVEGDELESEIKEIEEDEKKMPKFEMNDPDEEDEDDPDEE